MLVFRGQRAGVSGTCAYDALPTCRQTLSPLFEGGSRGVTKRLLGRLWLSVSKSNRRHCREVRHSVGTDLRVRPVLSGKHVCTTKIAKDTKKNMAHSRAGVHWPGIQCASPLFEGGSKGGGKTPARPPMAVGIGIEIELSSLPGSQAFCRGGPACPPCAVWETCMHHEDREGHEENNRYPHEAATSRQWG